MNMTCSTGPSSNVTKFASNVKSLIKFDQILELCKKNMDKNAALEWPTMISVFKVRKQMPPNFLLACWASRLAMAPARI